MRIEGATGGTLSRKPATHYCPNFPNLFSAGLITALGISTQKLVHLILLKHRISLGESDSFSHMLPQVSNRELAFLKSTRERTLEIFDRHLKNECAKLVEEMKDDPDRIDDYYEHAADLDDLVSGVQNLGDILLTISGSLRAANLIDIEAPKNMSPLAELMYNQNLGTRQMLLLSARHNNDLARLLNDAVIVASDKTMAEITNEPSIPSVGAEFLQ